MNYLVALKVGEETKRAALVFDDEGKVGALSFDGQHVCKFELQTPGAIGDYFTAENFTRHQIRDIMGIETESVTT